VTNVPVTVAVPSKALYKGFTVRVRLGVHPCGILTFKVYITGSLIAVSGVVMFKEETFQNHSLVYAGSLVSVQASSIRVSGKVFRQYNRVSSSKSSGETTGSISTVLNAKQPADVVTFTKRVWV